VIDDAELQWHTFALQSKGDCYLSANTKLVGVEKAVMLSSNEPARSFIDATLATLRRRHGNAVRATVACCRTTQVQVDDLMVQARIEEKLFAPNKRPTSLSADGLGLRSRTKNHLKLIE
jgi:hypothetical protein